MTQRVWITGVGAATPLGSGFATFAENLLRGKSGVTAHQLLPQDPGQRQFIAAVDEIPVPPGWKEADFRRYNRLEQLTLSCTARALDDAGLGDERGDLRIGIVLGLGAEYLRVWELDTLAGGNRVYTPDRDVLSVVHFVHRELGLTGPAVSVAAACASGGYALGVARRWIQLGWVDVCLAGGCDLITPMSYGGFYNLRALSRRDDSPSLASRPFDRARDGFVMGEGGRVLVLEELEHAQARGARIYAEVAGVGMSSDAFHMTLPDESGETQARAITMALGEAGLAASDVDYVNAHGTSTGPGDIAETRALKVALGEHAGRVAISSSKSMIGHCLGASGAIEAVVTVLTIVNSLAHPTINLTRPDPECDLDFVPGEKRFLHVDVAASNSFGFGGHNVTLVFRRYEE